MTDKAQNEAAAGIPNLAKFELPLVELTDPAVLGPVETSVLLAGAPWHKLVVVGDSLAEGLGDPAPGYSNSPWADRVAKAFYKVNDAFEYVNFGLRYLTAREILESQVDRAVAERADLAIMIGGGNDLFQEQFEIESLEQTLDEIAVRLAVNGADVVGFSLMNVTRAFDMPNAELVGERIEQLNDALRRIAARRRFFSLVDMASEHFATDPRIYSDDKLHANMRGHATIASATILRLGELIRRRENSKAA